MSPTTLASAGKIFKITTYPAAARGKKFPNVVLIHGDFGLGVPYSDEIRGFAKDLAGRGYVTGVRQRYEGDPPHLVDEVIQEQTSGDAVAAGAKRPDAERLGLIALSLDTATAIAHIAANPKGTVRC